MAASIGLDFGTTNTVATTINADGQAEALSYTYRDQGFDAFRWVLCYWQTEENDARRTEVEAGPWAIDQFLELAGDCRFIQSYKTFAASPLFTDTRQFHDLMSSFLGRVRARA